MWHGQKICRTLHVLPRGVVAWPSGLRRQLKALVREGVGSNPTAIIHNGVTLAEWLRRWPAKPLCSARVGSNPSGDGIWGCSSHGRASALHAEGKGIDTPHLQYYFLDARISELWFWRANMEALAKLVAKWPAQLRRRALATTSAMLGRVVRRSTFWDNLF